MGTIGDILLSLVAIALVVALSLEVAFEALVAVWLLVPSNLSVPHAPHILLVHTVVLYAFVFRLLARRGPGEPSSEAYSPTFVHGALGAFVLVGFFGGVIFTPRGNSLAGDLHSWLSDLNLFILLVVVLAVVRTITAWRAVAIVAVVVCAVVAIGFWEHFTHRGWSNFFFEHLPASYLAAGVGPLQTRGGHVRSQGAAQFALEYGWVLVMLMPLLLVSVVHWSHGRIRLARLANVIPLLAGVAVVFTGSRSATIAFVAALVLLVVLTGRDQRMLVWGALAVMAGAITTVAHPSLITSVFSAGKSDPASVRLNRLQPLFALVVHHPFTGLGLTGLTSTFAFSGLDDGYAVLYGTLGVVGVLAWLSVLSASAATAGHGLKAPPGTIERRLGAACLVGVLAAAVAAAAYDFTNTSQSSWTLVILAALGVAAVEGANVRVVRRHWSSMRLLLPTGGVLVGLSVLAIAPVSSSLTLTVITDAPGILATETAYYPNQGTEMVNTLCPVVTNPDTVIAGTTVGCLQYAQIFPDFPGLAVVQVRGPTPQFVTREVNSALTPISRQMPLEVAPEGAIATGKPSWAITAPLSGGVAGLLGMLLLPSLSRKRPLVNPGSRNGP